MMHKVLVCALVALSLQSVFCANRQDILNEFGPVYNKIKDLYYAKWLGATDHYNRLTRTINLNTGSTVNSTVSQINNLKQYYDGTVASAAGNTVLLNCLAPQRTKINYLSSGSYTNCFSNSQSSALTNSKYRLYQLYSAALNGPYFCGNLNPIDLQIQVLDNCLRSSVSDLYSYTNVIEKEYWQLGNTTLNSNRACVTSVSTGVLNQIRDIEYQINSCVFNIRKLKAAKGNLVDKN